MSIRTILAAVSGGSASAGAIEAAFTLARRLNAHVEALHVHADEREAMMYGDAFSVPMTGEVSERIAAEADATAATARSGFDAAVARQGLRLASAPPAAGAAASPTAAWREETGNASAIIARRARVFDLVVLGRSDRVVNRPFTDAVEAAVLDSGRPVLLAAASTQAIGRRIAVGWNGTIEAVHALAGALPFLAAAEAVRIITIGADEEGMGALAVEHLAWHGIAATARLVPPDDGVGPGTQLLAAAREEGADLLVMGAYGHAPWRELLFGGATREVVETSLMALLLAH
jgi:nucleotide-binding universal stress UspA family protein